MPRLMSALAWAFLCLALGAQAGRWIPVLDLLTAVTPLLALVCLAGLATALAIGRGRRHVLALAVWCAALAASAERLAPALPGPAGSGPPTIGAQRLRVIQLNVGGQTLADPDRVAAWLAAQSPDLVLLDDGDSALRAALARRGLLWRRGIAWTAIASPRPLGASIVRFTARDWEVMPDMARGRYGAATAPAEIIATHLPRPLPDRSAPNAQDIGRLCDLAARYDRRSMIVGGDFNLVSWSFALGRVDRCLGLTRRDRAAFTWPARVLGADWPVPFLPIDHIYAGPRWRTVAERVGPPIGATHRPLVIDLAAMP